MLRYVGIEQVTVPHMPSGNTVCGISDVMKRVIKSPDASGTCPRATVTVVPGGTTVAKVLGLPLT